MTWVLEHESDDHRTRIEHRDGVPWWEAPLPPRLHKCKPQTNGWLNYFDNVQRCACGAMRDNRYPTWTGKNERRKGDRARRKDGAA